MIDRQIDRQIHRERLESANRKNTKLLTGEINQEWMVILIKKLQTNYLAKNYSMLVTSSQNLEGLYRLYETAR